MSQEGMGGVEGTPAGLTAVPSGAAGGDLAGTYPSPTIAALAVTDAKVATANKDGTAGTASMRTLGTGAAQAAAGNDSRLSDSRAPSGAAAGDLAGTYPNPTLGSVVTAGTKGGTGKLISGVQYDAKGRIIAVASEGVRGVDYAGPVIGPRGIYSELGRGLLGFAGNEATIGEEWDDFTGAQGGNLLPGWVFAGVSTGGGAYTVTSGGGGVFRALSGATANSQSLWTRNIGLVSNVTTAKWYMAWRFRIPTTPDAQSKILCGLLDSAQSKSIGAGFSGGLNATNLIVQYDGSLTAGTALNLGTAVNTSFHVVELWGTGSTTLNARLDGGTPASVVMASASANYYYPFFLALNGTTAADQRIELDYFYAMFQRI